MIFSIRNRTRERLEEINQRHLLEMAELDSEIENLNNVLDAMQQEFAGQQDELRRMLDEVNAEEPQYINVPPPRFPTVIDIDIDDDWGDDSISFSHPFLAPDNLFSNPHLKQKNTEHWLTKPQLPDL